MNVSNFWSERCNFARKISQQNCKNYVIMNTERWICILVRKLNSKNKSISWKLNKRNKTVSKSYKIKQDAYKTVKE